MKKTIFLSVIVLVCMVVMSITIVNLSNVLKVDTYLTTDSTNKQNVNNKTIVLNGDDEITMMVGEDFVDPGYVISGDVTSDVTVSGNVDTNKIGTYTITYKSGDNVTTRTVHVIMKKEPHITLNGSTYVRVKQNIDIYVEYGASAVDNRGKKLDVTISGSVDINKTGTYELLYGATDNDGNSTTVTRYVSVIYVPVVMTGTLSSSFSSGVDNYNIIGTLMSSEEGRLVRWEFSFDNPSDAREVKLSYLNNGVFDPITFTKGGFIFGGDGIALRNGSSTAFKVNVTLPKGVDEKEYMMTIKVVDVKTGITIKSDKLVAYVYRAVENFEED